MTRPEDQRESWEQIDDLVRAGAPDELESFLDSISPGEVARALSRLDQDQHEQLLTLLEPEKAADIIEELSDAQGADLLELLPVAQAAAIVNAMESDERADVLAEVNEDEAAQILNAMDPEDAEDARRLLEYASDTAGGIMITEFLAFAADLTVNDVIRNLRDNAEQYADYSVQYTYVTSEKRKLVGVVPLRDLLLARGSRQLSDLMIANPLSVRFDASLHELEQTFDRHDFFGIPVVDAHGALIGVVRHHDVEESLGERAETTFMRFSGIVGGDEFRSMPFASRTLRRLSFLSPNILLNLLAASVIAANQATLEQLIILAVFLPIISDMSGCSGNQAVAVSIRELSLGLVRPRDLLLVLRKECQVGLANGLALGLMLGTIATVYGYFSGDFEQPVRYSLYFGAVIGGAMALNGILSVCLGGLIPLILKGIKVDPALAAAPILTTVTDMCGFFLVLTLAQVALRYMT